METKICNKCNTEKIVTEFYFRSDTKKYRNSCKDCIKKEKVIRESDPKIRERRARKEKERRAKDDGTINAKLREYRKTEKAKAIAREWSKNNKDKTRNYNRTQRARRKFALKAELSASTAEVKSWLDAQIAVCTYCETEIPKDNLSPSLLKAFFAIFLAPLEKDPKNITFCKALIPIRAVDSVLKCNLAASLDLAKASSSE